MHMHVCTHAHTEFLHSRDSLSPHKANNDLHCVVGSLNKASSSNMLPAGFHQTSICVCVCVCARVCVCLSICLHSHITGSLPISLANTLTQTDINTRNKQLVVSIKTDILVN